MIDHHDALLSKLIDDAFYGRPLIAVTGVEGAGKTTLARRFAQQFANEAECIALKASDFKNRDDFIQRLVSKLSPDSVEYAADTPLNTIVDYAGSLADQERLLVLIVDDAESLSDAFLETLYELIDEADEASLCCLLLGDPALKDAIERADPNGGIEDFSWFDLPKLEEPERPVDPDQPIAATATATITATTEAVAPIDELLQKPDVHEAQVESGATESAEPIELAPLDIEKESDETFDELLGMMANDAGAGAAVDTESDDDPEFDGSSEPERELEPETETETETEPEPEPEPEPDSAFERVNSDAVQPGDSGLEPAASEDEFARNIDEWVEPDTRPGLGGARFGAGEDLDLDFGNGEQPEDVGQARRDEASTLDPDIFGDDEDDVNTSASKTDYLAAATGFARSVPLRLAAARNYWLAAGGLMLLVLAVIVFWRIPDEPSSGTIELAAPVASRAGDSASLMPPTSGQISRPSADRSVVEPDLEIVPSAAPVIANTATLSQPASPQRPASQERVASPERIDSEQAVLAPDEIGVAAVSVSEARPVARSSSAAPTTSPTPAPTRAATSPTLAATRQAPATPVSPAAASSLQQNRLSGSAFERQLLAMPAGSFTLQVLGASSEANVQAFVERNGGGLRQTLGYYRSQRGGAPWFIVAYGEFTTREQANATLRRLPQALSAAGPWVRPIAAAQAEIRAAR
ncbi:AAA family ATPase [Gammaproteobacteria bacterium]|nr:AAA family ATPase [Gammaproteobacteria bacterium]